MGLFDDIGGGDALGSFLQYNPATAIPYAIGDKIDVLGVHAKDRLNDYQNQQSLFRQQNKQNQYNLLGQMQGPQVSPLIQQRIKALQDQSKSSSLVEDPYFQQQRSQLVQGGQNALASVQNKNRAYNTAGGFANTGSVQNIYDRLGSQLAGLVQQSINLKDQKSQQAAQMSQGLADAQTAYNNSIVQAKMAIEAGDAQAAQQAMAQAYAAREQVQQRQNQLIMGGLGLGVSALAGNPFGAAASARGIAGASAPIDTGSYLSNADSGQYSVGSGMGYGDNAFAGAGGFGGAPAQGGYAPKAYGYQLLGK